MGVVSTGAGRALVDRPASVSVRCRLDGDRTCRLNGGIDTGVTGERCNRRDMLVCSSFGFSGGGSLTLRSNHCNYCNKPSCRICLGRRDEFILDRNFARLTRNCYKFFNVSGNDGALGAVAGDNTT